MKNFTILIAVYGLAGCAGLTSPARIHELDTSKQYWFDYDASRRGTIFANTQSCAEPSPDVALTLAAKAEAAVDYRELNASAKGDLAISAVKLADRSQMVLFFREALYRICEISANKGIKSDDAVALYKEVIQTALRLGAKEAIDVDLEGQKANVLQAQQKIKEAEINKEKYQTMLQNQASSEIEKTNLKLEIARLNDVIAKTAKEQADAATRVQTISNAKQAQATADIQNGLLAAVKANQTLTKVTEEIGAAPK